MVHHKTLRIFFLQAAALVTVAMFCLSLTAGCSKQAEKSPSGISQSEKKESPVLKEMQTDIELVLKEYEKVYLMQTVPVPDISNQQKSEAEQQGQQEKQNEEKSDGKEEEQEEKQGQNSGESQSQQMSQSVAELQPDWSKLEEDITRIHEQWNTFQVEAIRNGASGEMIEEFSSKLNELTMTFTKQEIYEGLIAINDLYGKTTDFEKLFKTESPPDIKNILYYSRMAAYNILYGDEIGAEDATNDAFASWEAVKPQVTDTSSASKLEYSLNELSLAVKAKDPNLVKIKAQIVEKNVKDIIKSMESEQS